MKTHRDKDLNVSYKEKMKVSSDVGMNVNVKKNANDVKDMENTVAVNKKNIKRLNKPSTLGDQEKLKTRENKFKEKLQSQIKNALTRRGRGAKFQNKGQLMRGDGKASSTMKIQLEKPSNKKSFKNHVICL